MEDDLYQYLLPYYRAGLDAVIVQDLGVLSFIKEHFPDLPSHASTQMTITGPESAKMLEDMGYFCVDNLPGEMLGNFAALCERADPAIEKAALGMDSRAGVFHYDSKKLIAELDKLEIPYDILFLECQDQMLERRYQETRRRHPLSSCTPKGKIILNAQLIKVPRPCIEYVITHELCHLVHPDHTKAFWELLQKEMPDWERWKNKLERFML